MATAVTCDHCKQPVTGVVCQLRVLDATRVDTSPIISSAHLHWDCIPDFGRCAQKEEAAT